MPNYFLVDDDDGYMPFQVCSCGCEQVHIKSIQAFCRQEDCDVNFYDIDMIQGLKSNIENYPEKYCPSSRRNAITVQFYCEEGCLFSLTIAQHKGRNYVEGKTTPNAAFPEDDEFEVIE